MIREAHFMEPHVSDQGAEGVASALESHIAAMGSAVVAFSGGVDSTVVARAAFAALGTRMVAVTASSESSTAEDVTACRTLADGIGMPHEIISYSELAIPGYAENTPRRCFHCKDALHGRLVGLAQTRGYTAVIDGSNASDTGDYRPGMQAARGHGIRSPLMELQINKEGVRALARHYGLPNHDRPASPCLSSRVPYGEPVTADKLAQIAAAEAHLRTLGLRDLRCRHHGKLARIEVPEDQLEVVIASREGILREFRRLGFLWISLDLAGFRSGSLNDALKPAGVEQVSDH